MHSKILARHPTGIMPGIIGRIIEEKDCVYVVKYPENRTVEIRKSQVGEVGEKTLYVGFRDFEELEKIGMELAILWQTIEKMSKDHRTHLVFEAKQSFELRPKGDF